MGKDPVSEKLSEASGMDKLRKLKANLKVLVLSLSGKKGYLPNSIYKSRAK